MYEEKPDNGGGYFVNDLEVQEDINGSILTSDRSRVDNFSDWIITVKWTHNNNSTNRWFKATYGTGIVYVYLSIQKE